MWILLQETRNDLKHIINDPLKREEREQSVGQLKKHQMPICTNQMAYRESKHRSSIKAAKHKYKRRSEVLGQASSVKLTQEQ